MMRKKKDNSIIKLKISAINNRMGQNIVVVMCNMLKQKQNIQMKKIFFLQECVIVISSIEISCSKG